MAIFNYETKWQVPDFMESGWIHVFSMQQTKILDS